MKNFKEQLLLWIKFWLFIYIAVRYTVTPFFESKSKTPKLILIIMIKLICYINKPYFAIIFCEDIIDFLQNYEI